MAPPLLQQRRTHNTLLFQKLLNLRDGASPFTLVLDSLEQSSGPVVREFAKRAKISKSKIILIAFATLKRKISLDVDIFISTKDKSLANLRTEILSHLPPPNVAPTAAASNPPRYLLIIDTLHPLAARHAPHLATFLSSLLISPQVSLLATYHTDILLPELSLPYTPDPLTTLTYLATAILSLSSLAQVLARKRARDRSVQEPVFGLAEGREGIIVGLDGKTNNNVEEGVVINMEIRRRSGRGVVENFVLLPASKPLTLSEFVLLDDHPLYSSVPLVPGASHEGAEDDDVETTFNLGLTEKQKRDRENVVLPYFDAQKEGGAAGPGEGGRILYEMGSEDREDFDDEEDEI